MRKRFVLIVIFTIILCGCKLPFIEDGVDKQNEIIVQSEESMTREDMPIQMEEPTPVLIEESNLTEESDLIRQNTDIVADNDGRKEVHTSWYAYKTLSEQERTIYLEMLSILQKSEEDIGLSTLDVEALDVIFQCVMMDHPEIFYVDGYTFKQYTEADILKKITFSGIYVYDQEEVEQRQLAIENQVANILNGIDSSASDYEKVKYVYEYIVDHTQYNLQSVDNQNICSVFLAQESVCQGYAKATQYLLNELGIESMLVTGSVKNGQGHAWNLVKMDNEYYYVDTTWGDASYTLVGGSTAEMMGNPDINYDYLGVTTEALQKTHVIDEVISMPICSSMNNNYYIKEGIYFTSLDLEKLETIFQNAKIDDKEMVILKCSNQQVYEEMLVYLLDEQKIFDYLDLKEESVAYANDDEQFSLSFWL